jgi:hypothetical protein
MKGNQLTRLALTLLVITTVFWVGYRTVSHQPPKQIPSDTAYSTSISTKEFTGKDPEKRPTLPTLRATLLMHTASAPLHFKIIQSGRELLSEKDQISPGEYRAAVEISKGEDLQITADWSDEEQHSLRVEVLVHGYQAPLEKNFWGQKSIEDNFPIPSSFLS